MSRRKDHKDREWIRPAKKIPRKHFFRGIFQLGYKDSNLEMTESESFIGEDGESVFIRGSGLTIFKSFSIEF